ncbi:MAG: hypothetical protein QXV17_10510 [Candidatus Micrarchaeaceae archaeon]
MSDNVKLISCSKILKRVNFVGLNIKQGDIIMVYTSLRGVGEQFEFVGFNPHLFAFRLKDSDGLEVIIPWKHIKKIVVVGVKG